MLFNICIRSVIRIQLWHAGYLMLYKIKLGAVPHTSSANGKRVQNNRGKHRSLSPLIIRKIALLSWVRNNNIVEYQ